MYRLTTGSVYSLPSFASSERVLCYLPKRLQASVPTQLLRSKKTALVSNSPLDAPDYFNLKDIVTVHELFKYRAHLGHRSILRNDYMSPYLFGSRQGVDIIDLEQTRPLLFDALNFTAHIAYRKGIILFLSQNQQMLPLVEETAKHVGEFSHCRKWSSNVFTDTAKMFNQAVRLPDLCIFLSTHSQVAQQPHLGVRDAAKLLIPTVGIVDTNSDPRLITYPVPGNDDSPVTIRLWCALFAEAIIRGKRRLERDLKVQKQIIHPQTNPSTSEPVDFSDVVENDIDS